MMRRAVSGIVAVVILLAVCPLTPAYTFRDNSAAASRRWAANPIIIAFSSSLNSPPPNIRPGSDVIGAAHRALQHWSSVANIKFLETTSSTSTISPQNSGDGVNIITVSADNALVFGSSESPGRTRVFYDPGGVIVEADIALNPNQLFSSDGTPGTYDLESTFTHEVGHLLGLEHSAVIGATMQPRQAKNGLFNLPAFTQRTLSEDDCAGIRALYGSAKVTGSISGKLTAGVTTFGSQQNSSAAYVFAEDVSTGKLIAGNVAMTNGEFHIEGLGTGSYRLLGQSLNGPITPPDVSPAGGLSTALLERAFDGEAAQRTATVNVVANTNSSPDFPVALNYSPSLRPRVIGLNGELSTVALPLEAGKTSTIFIGGEGVDQILGSGISIESPFMEIDPDSVALQKFSTPYPVISFDVAVAPDAQSGDYSIRLRLAGGDLAYLAGALTIDPGADSSAFANASDDPQFFVRQHYRDFLGREPDMAGLEYWTSQIKQCGTDAACMQSQRLAVSADFFAESEFQQTGGFIYRVYQAALTRAPVFSEFNKDRTAVTAGGNLESIRESFTLDFVQRPEFVQKYPATLKSEEFIDRFLASIREGSKLDLSRQREKLLGLWDGTDVGRAAILRLVAENPEFIRAEYNRAFVLMQYFGYLRRDADKAGYDFWVNLMNGRRSGDPGAYRSMVCAFITSAEYQLRFGIAATHTNAECGP